MSLFNGYKIDYNQAEADMKLAETENRRKEVRAECYKAVKKQLDDDLLEIKKIYPNCIAINVIDSAEFANLNEDFIFSYSHTEKFEGYVINKYLVKNEFNYQKECYEDNYHEKLEWSYGLLETVNVSYVIFRSAEDRNNYIDIGKYIKIKNFSENEFAEHDKVLKSDSVESLKIDKENINAAKKLYASNKLKNTLLNSTTSFILLLSTLFYIMTCVSVFMICYGGERNSFFMWFTDIPFYCYIIIWGVDLVGILLGVFLFRRTYGKVNASAIGTYLMLTGIVTVLMVIILLKYDYFTGNESDAIKWLKLLAYVSAILIIIALVNAFSPIRLAVGSEPEKALNDRELKYRKALEYMNDPINKKCNDLLTERKNFILSHTVLNREKENTTINNQKLKEQHEKDETNEILKKFEG